LGYSASTSFLEKAWVQMYVYCRYKRKFIKHAASAIPTSVWPSKKQIENSEVRSDPDEDVKTVA